MLPTTRLLSPFIGTEFLFLMGKAILGLFKNNSQMGQRSGGKIRSPEENRTEILFQPFKS